MTELKLRADMACAAITCVSDGQSAVSLSERYLDIITNNPFTFFVLKVLIEVSFVRIFHGIDKVSLTAIVVLGMVH